MLVSLPVNSAYHDEIIIVKMVAIFFPLEKSLLEKISFEIIVFTSVGNLLSGSGLGGSPPWS